ncbi:hypothetical protein DPMN_029607 [Dreissena polymorpha]|uniref:Uncharacterized protein n=1 Tax=Dreissena polymorpha TaxID=45954 RepID=A0A9D4LZJ1_DREPO|nr:hypothetical protein DPMN_029607 [Dreissena polymorpha]
MITNILYDCIWGFVKGSVLSTPVKEGNVPEVSDFSAASIILPPIAIVFWKKALQTHFVSK